MYLDYLAHHWHCLFYKQVERTAKTMLGIYWR